MTRSEDVADLGKAGLSHQLSLCSDLYAHAIEDTSAKFLLDTVKPRLGTRLGNSVLLTALSPFLNGLNMSGS